MNNERTTSNGKPSRPRYYHYRNHNRNHGNQARNAPAVVDQGDPESQRKRLEEQLINESYECMVCCEEVSKNHQVGVMPTS